MEAVICWEGHRFPRDNRRCPCGHDAGWYDEGGKWTPERNPFPTTSCLCCGVETTTAEVVPADGADV